MEAKRFNQLAEIDAKIKERKSLIERLEENLGLGAVHTVILETIMREGAKRKINIDDHKMIRNMFEFEIKSMKEEIEELQKQFNEL